MTPDHPPVKHAGKVFSSPMFWAGLLAVAAIVLVCVVLFISRRDTDAVKACKLQIETELVSPASAEWDLNEMTSSESATLEVRGTVDSENSFGARIRSQVRCVVTDGVVTESAVY